MRRRGICQTTHVCIKWRASLGDTTYEIEVRATTGAGAGPPAMKMAILPAGQPPVLDFVVFPELVPVPVVDAATGEASATEESFTVAFTIPAEANVNGPVDRFLLFVQRQPSSNSEVGAWFDSNQATSNWTSYASLDKCLDQTTGEYVSCSSGSPPATGNRLSKRQASNMQQRVTVGDSGVEYGQTVEVCNGRMVPGADYRVRYSFFSGD